MLNACIYHQLPPTCFGVYYTIFRVTTALFAQKLYVFLQRCYKMYNIHWFLFIL